MMNAKKYGAALMLVAVVGLPASSAKAVSVSYGTFNLTTETFAGFSNTMGTVVVDGVTLDEYSNGTTDPNAIYNPTSTHTDAYTPGPSPYQEHFAAGSLEFGPTGGPVAAEYTFADATTLSAGSVTAAFSSVQLGGRSPDAYIYTDIGGVKTLQDLGVLVPATGTTNAIVDGTASGYFNMTASTFGAGDVIAFIVGNYGTSDLATTRVDVNVGGTGNGFPTPLPASAGVGFSMLGAFGVFSLIRKRLTQGARIA